MREEGVSYYFLDKYTIRKLRSRGNGDDETAENREKGISKLRECSPSPFRSFFAVSVEQQHSVFQALPFNSTERNAVTSNGGEGTEMRIVSKSGRLLTGHVHRKPRERFLRSFVSELLSLLSYGRLALPA